MFITRRELDRDLSGLGEQPNDQVTLMPKGVVVRGKHPHWLVQTAVGSIVSAVIFMTMWKKFM